MECRIVKKRKILCNYNFQNYEYSRSANALQRKTRGKVLGINTGANQWPASGERGEHTRTCMRCSLWRIHSSRPHSRCMLPVEKPGLWETDSKQAGSFAGWMASMQRAEVCQPKFSARANLVNSLITGRGTRSHANATWPKTRRWCMHPIARRVNSVLMHRVPYPAEYLSIAGEGGEANDPQPDEKFPPVSR